MKHPDGTECNFMDHDEINKYYHKADEYRCILSDTDMSCAGASCIHQRILSQLKLLNGEEP